MNLVMCCTPIGREDRYLEELRFVVLGAIFFKNLYPNSKVFVATTPDAKIPDYLLKILEVVRYPFGSIPFAMSRMNFYKEFIESEFLTDDTLITGCDVLFCKKIILPDDSCQMAMTYRYHRSMPYCSDFILVKKKYKNIAADFCRNVLTTMGWMPKEIQSGWADQLSMAIEMGFLDETQFDGNSHPSPKNKQILLLPGDDYLFTPNDYFSSVKSQMGGTLLNDTPDFFSLLNHSKDKTGLHFKGNRKHLFFIFAYLCKLNGIVNFEGFDTRMKDEFLFKEYFEYLDLHEKKKAA